MLSGGYKSSALLLTLSRSSAELLRSYRTTWNQNIVALKHICWPWKEDCWQFLGYACRFLPLWPTDPSCCNRVSLTGSCIPQQRVLPSIPPALEEPLKVGCMANTPIILNQCIMVWPHTNKPVNSIQCKLSRVTTLNCKSTSIHNASISLQTTKDQR